MYPELWGWYAAAAGVVALFAGFNLWAWRRDPSYRWYRDGLITVAILAIFWAILNSVYYTSVARVERGRIVAEVVFSPDGTRLASRARNGRVTLWDAATGRPERRLAAGKRPWWPWVASATEIVAQGRALAFTPDGGTLAVARQPDGIRLYDPVTGRLRRTLAAGEAVPLLDIAPDGRWMATSSDSGITLWDTRQWTPVRRLPRGRASDDVYDLALAPGRLFVLTARRVAVWDTARWRRNETFFYRWGSHRMAVSREGERVALVIDDPTQGSGIAVWDVGRRSPTRTLRPGGSESGLFSQVALSPDGKTLAESDVRGVILWNVSAGHRRRPLATGDQSAWCLAFSPDGTRLAAGFYDGTVRIWRL